MDMTHEAPFVAKALASSSRFPCSRHYVGGIGPQLHTIEYIYIYYHKSNHNSK